LRASEVARLRVKDVANGRLDCARLKGSLHTNRPLESDSNVLLDEKHALVAYLSERPTDESPFLFVSRVSAKARQRAAERRTDADRWGVDVDHTARGISRDAIAEVFEDACFRAGIESGRRNPHCAKHSLGAHLYRAGVDTFALQQILGHRDAKSTAVYAGVTQNEAHLKAKSAMSAIFA
jgi:site-specific recombinase XerD